VSQLLQKGLIKKYNQKTGNILALKGRLDFAKNLSLLLSKTYTVCQYVRPIDIFGSKPVIPRDYQELVITVGNPGSGKSVASYSLEKYGYKVCIVKCTDVKK
jgi:hypothetical protein